MTYKEFTQKIVENNDDDNKKNKAGNWASISPKPKIGEHYILDSFEFILLKITQK